MRPLDQVEIFELASAYAMAIKESLEKAWYDASGVSLSISFSTEPYLDAWAAVRPRNGPPTNHEIVLSYKLVEEIYGAALEYARFAHGRKGETHPLGLQMVPESFDMLAAAKFMFESGVIFVIFHELGHINQDHGSIRSGYSANHLISTVVNEFSINDGKRLSGDLASIYHATEMAADFEALDWMSTSLAAQFKGVDFIERAYLQSAIVSAIMLIFNGDNPPQLDRQPAGSHPYPWLRMDLWAQAYSERTRVLSNSLMIDTATDVRKTFMDAAYLATLSWMTRYQLTGVYEYERFVSGPMSHENYSEYMRAVVNVWTAEYRHARSARKYGFPFSVPYYTDELRAKVGAVKNVESFADHVRESCRF